MTDIEQKALALVKEVAEHDCYEIDDARFSDVCAALCRAIEQHEAFRQEVSDALLEYYGSYHNASGEPLERFIIPKPKPDPLVEVLEAMKDGRAGPTTESYAKCLRVALDALGFEIREKNDD